MKKMIKTFLQLVWLFLVTNIFGDEYKLNFEGKIYLNDLNIPVPSFEKANRLDSREIVF
jgi:hypothetical protein